MNTRAAALLLFSLPIPRYTPPSNKPISEAVTQHAHKGGRWYLAQTGHAVYCYGPVMTVNQPAGGLQRVATYCQGGETIVPLHD
jgi:hypothetical protein